MLVFGGVSDSLDDTLSETNMWNTGVGSDEFYELGPGLLAGSMLIFGECIYSFEGT